MSSESDSSMYTAKQNNHEFTRTQNKNRKEHKRKKKIKSA